MKSTIYRLSIAKTELPAAVGDMAPDVQRSWIHNVQDFGATQFPFSEPVYFVAEQGSEYEQRDELLRIADDVSVLIKDGKLKRSRPLQKLLRKVRELNGAVVLNR